MMSAFSIVLLNIDINTLFLTTGLVERQSLSNKSHMKYRNKRNKVDQD